MGQQLEWFGRVYRWAMIVVALVAVTLFAVATVYAQPTWTFPMTWDAQANATSYNVDRSTDNGNTWTNVAKPTTNSFTYTGSEPGFTCFRISACNNNGCTIRVSDFLCHDDSKKLPGQAANIGVK